MQICIPSLYLFCFLYRVVGYMCCTTGLVLAGKYAVSEWFVTCLTAQGESLHSCTLSLFLKENMQSVEHKSAGGVKCDFFGVHCG